MTDHYEMPHHRADECPHAGVGKACRPCRKHFDGASITADERADMRERYTANLPPAHDTAVRTAALRRLGHASCLDVPRLLDALDAAEAEIKRYRAQRDGDQRGEARAWLRAEASPLWYEKAGENEVS